MCLLALRICVRGSVCACESVSECYHDERCKPQKQDHLSISLCERACVCVRCLLK